ncbi:hypothetical protein J4Q44_G00257260 [Coregonus suidteri]|uniref:Uncharacterized protein n=1 Tax=Coregonus suidteri TaxID=861788 RepID=A0AAN8L1W5_9TELE
MYCVELEELVELLREKSFIGFISSVAANPMLRARGQCGAERPPCGGCRKRRLFRSTWIYVGEPDAAGVVNPRPSGLAVSRMEQLQAGLQ